MKKIINNFSKEKNNALYLIQVVISFAIIIFSVLLYFMPDMKELLIFIQSLFLIDVMIMFYFYTYVLKRVKTGIFFIIISIITLTVIIMNILA